MYSNPVAVPYLNICNNYKDKLCKSYCFYLKAFVPLYYYLPQKSLKLPEKNLFLKLTFFHSNANQWAM